MSSSPHTVPTFIDLPRDHGGHDDATNEVWYVASQLRAGTREFGVLVIFIGFAGPAPEPMRVVVSVAERGGPLSIGRHLTVAADELHVATDRLEVRTPSASLTGDLSGFALAVDLPELTIALELSGEQVLYNAGTGLWPWLSGTTHQVSFPSVAARGALTVEGTTHDVTGRSWYDRQWFAADARLDAFQWVGLCLDDGDALGVFDLAGAGGEWAFATHLRADGTHVVASVPSFRVGFAAPGAGEATTSDPVVHRLSIPAFDADLVVRGFKLHESPPAGDDGLGGYTAALAVEGTLGGAPVAGYGFTDVAAT